MHINQISGAHRVSTYLSTSREWLLGIELASCPAVLRRMYAMELSEKRGEGVAWIDIWNCWLGNARSARQFGDWMAAKSLASLIVSETNEIFSYQPQNCMCFIIKKSLSTDIAKVLSYCSSRLKMKSGREISPCFPQRIYQLTWKMKHIYLDISIAYCGSPDYLQVRFWYLVIGIYFWGGGFFWKKRLITNHGFNSCGIA